MVADAGVQVNRRPRAEGAAAAPGLVGFAPRCRSGGRVGTLRRPRSVQPPMPSFDIVSQVDQHELTNAIDQANRELSNRFDFRGVDASYAREGDSIVLSAPSDFQLQQMLEILRARLTARKIDVRCLEEGEPEVNLARAKQTVSVKQGIEQPLAKKIVGELKTAKIKVEAQINGDKLRVSGKKRDDLQAAMALLRKTELELPLQFENFRD